PVIGPFFSRDSMIFIKINDDPGSVRRVPPFPIRMMKYRHKDVKCRRHLVRGTKNRPELSLSHPYLDSVEIRSRSTHETPSEINSAQDANQQDAAAEPTWQQPPAW